ncbi:unnamed protein product [Urochloa humidicola]
MLVLAPGGIVRRRGVAALEAFTRCRPPASLICLERDSGMVLAQVHRGVVLLVEVIIATGLSERGGEADGAGRKEKVWRMKLGGKDTGGCEETLLKKGKPVDLEGNDCFEPGEPFHFHERSSNVGQRGLDPMIDEIEQLTWNLSSANQQQNKSNMSGNVVETVDVSDAGHVVLPDDVADTVASFSLHKDSLVLNNEDKGAVREGAQDTVHAGLIAAELQEQPSQDVRGTAVHQVDSNLLAEKVIERACPGDPLNFLGLTECAARQDVGPANELGQMGLLKTVAGPIQQTSSEDSVSHDVPGQALNFDLNVACPNLVGEFLNEELHAQPDITILGAAQGRLNKEHTGQKVAVRGVNRYAVPLKRALLCTPLMRPKVSQAKKHPSESSSAGQNVRRHNKNVHKSVLGISLDEQATTMLVRTVGVLREGDKLTEEAIQQFGEQLAAPLHADVVGDMRAKIGLPEVSGRDALSGLLGEAGDDEVFA